MPPCGEELHQSVSPVLAVQTEGQRHKRAAQPHARDKACHLIDTAHIKYDYENKNGEQAAGEEEEVLRPQPLELHLAAHAFIDRIFGHRLKEKRTQKRGGDDQEDTGSEPARSGFRRIRIARTELLIDPHSADQADDGANGVDQLGRRVEIRRDHLRSLLNAGHAVTLLRCGVLHRGEQSYGDSCRTENEFSFHG